MAFYHPDQHRFQHFHRLRLPYFPLFAFQRAYNRNEDLDLERRSVGGGLTTRNEEWRIGEGSIEEPPALNSVLRHAFRDFLCAPRPRMFSLDLHFDSNRFQRTRIIFKECCVLPKDESRGGDVNSKRVWKRDQSLCCPDMLQANEGRGVQTLKWTCDDWKGVSEGTGTEAGSRCNILISSTTAARLSPKNSK